MYWQENEQTVEAAVPDEIVDVLFSLQCRTIPVDHAHALSQALLERAPWLAEPGAGIHTIHVAGSQNGWERPEHGADQHLHLSRRTKLCIRVPKARLDELKSALEGQTIRVAGSPLSIGAGKERLLSRETTVLARYVAGPEGVDETAFLHWAAHELAALDIRMRKALCGKSTGLTVPDGSIETRSLLLADLSADEAILLQQQGLGPHREMGCGIFLPHKGVEAVHKQKKS
jgi:CRISPR-associated protein Cas6